MPKIDDLQFRNGTAAEWTAANSNDILLGEPCYEKDTGKMKIGDGVNSYNDLPYFEPGGGSSTDSYTPLAFASPIVLPLDGNFYKTTLEGDFPYSHGTVTEGKSVVHTINTDAVSTPITLTWDSAYTYVDGEGEEMDDTYDLPAGAGKEYTLYFFALPSGNIRVVIDGLPEEETGGGVTNLAATLSSSSVIITSDTGTDATIPAVDATNAGVVTPTQKSTWDAKADAADITAAVNAVIDSSPGALDTLNELAAALGDDANFATTVTNSLAGKENKIDYISKTYASTITFDLLNDTRGAWKYTEGGAATWAFSNPPSDAAKRRFYEFEVTLANVSHVITLPANVYEAGVLKSSITLYSANGATQFVSLTWDGSKYEIDYIPVQYSVPAGGTTGQGLVKNSNTDGDVSWGTVGGGGSVTYATLAEINTGTEAAKAIAPDQLAGSKYLTQDGGKIAATLSGTNTYTGTLTPAITSYVDGQRFLVKVANAPTGFSTLGFNGISAKKLFKAPTVQVTSGDLIANQRYWVVYDSTLDSSSGGWLIVGYAYFVDSATIDFQYGASPTAIVIDGSISNAKLANMGTDTVKGAVVAGVPIDRPVADINTLTSRKFKTKVTAATSETMDLTATTWIFNGTTTTWTLPAVSGNTDLIYYIKNRGSGSITLQRAGSDSIYDTSAVNSITIAAGASATIQNDGSYWVTL